MMGWIRASVDTFRGRGDAAPTVPPMDGALRPNTLLETADTVLRVDAPDNLQACGEGILFTSGAAVLLLDPASGAARVYRGFDHAISSLAANHDIVAAGLDDGSIHVWGPNRPSATFTELDGERLVCPTALTFGDADTLIVCQGSSRNSPSRWQRDLMGREAAGSVWQVSMADGTARKLADRLGFPYGAVACDGGIVVAESWRHRLLQLGGDGATPVLADLPGYPARIVASAHGGYWLCVFAPRSQLIEFTLREPAYRDRMMRELAPEHWIAPTLSPARSFLEPMQGGALRSHGILKPWSPTRSYGLLVRLDARFRPVASYHSRADGNHHGITSCIEVGSRLLVTSKGGNAILAMPAVPGGRA
jgi:hypothetical protein